MATKKPRLTISLDKNTYEVISQLAQLQSRPKSAIITELLETVSQPLARTVSLLQAASEAPESVRNAFADAIEDLHTDLSMTVGGANSEVDLMIQRMRSDSH